jgi:hypothetical protein
VDLEAGEAASREGRTTCSDKGGFHSGVHRAKHHSTEGAKKKMTVAERERKLALLAAEVSRDFGWFVPALKDGIKVVLVDEEELAPTLDPDALRKIGGLVVLCDHYGASVIFTKRDRYRYVKLNRNVPSTR